MNQILRRYSDQLERDLVTGIAAGLWQVAWRGHSRERVPPTPAAAFEPAHVLAQSIVNLTRADEGDDALSLATIARRSGGARAVDGLMVGRALALEATGGGAVVAFPHKMPRFEVSYDGEYIEWLPRDAAVAAARPNPDPAMPFRTARDFTEALAEADERTEKAARRIQETADTLAAEGAGWIGSDKVFICDVAARLGSTTTRIAALLLVGRNKGWIRLARADLAAAMDPAKIAGSAVQMPGEGYGSTVHFVQQTEPPRPPPAPRRPLPRGKVGSTRPPVPVARGDASEDLTTAQLHALRRDRRSVSDARGTAIAEAAMSPHEGTDAYGDPLVDSEGQAITRAAARHMARALLAQEPLRAMDWYNAAVQHGAGRAEWLAIAAAVQADIRSPDVADLGARVRDARDRAAKATMP